MAAITKATGRASVRALTSRLSLATKLYSIFALFAVLVAAITALSDYNSRQNAVLTEAVATASRAALNVERVNSLVYAVVMESRGVYMSTDVAASSDLTATAETLSREVEKFFGNLRADPLHDIKRTGT